VDTARARVAAVRRFFFLSGNLRVAAGLDCAFSTGRLVVLFVVTTAKRKRGRTKENAIRKATAENSTLFRGGNWNL
jgi:hypothetical protein